MHQAARPSQRSHLIGANQMVVKQTPGKKGRKRRIIVPPLTGDHDPKPKGQDKSPPERQNNDDGTIAPDGKTFPGSALI
jgi:hypothetical protein